MNAKNKGNTFERKVAKMLSEWAGVKFMRTPGSGAIHNFKDKRVVSDIVPPLSIGNFPFSIECKNVKCSWEFSTLLDRTSTTINSHWKQCEEDAKREGLIPMLVFTKNFRSILAIIPAQVWNYFPSDVMGEIPTLLLDYVCETQSLIMFKFENFLEALSINTLLECNLSELYIPPQHD